MLSDMNPAHHHPHHSAMQLRLGGQVQGVGFRPFVYRQARRFAIDGWVRNHGSEVMIHAQGGDDALKAFIASLLDEAPPLAAPQLLEQHPVTPLAHSGFTILPSDTDPCSRPHIPPDQFVCDDCLRELKDAQNHRYRYPFINCTQCGPRYTLIAALPYDRQRTAMADFPLCPACRREYDDPHDRRFHAEPLACPSCGPQLRYVDHTQHLEGNEAALAGALAALRRGAIVAVKGIGGYHLVCDARNEAAVQRLRSRKRRPHKPLALMFPQRGEDGLQAVRSWLSPTAEEAALLRSPQRPIVLCQRRTQTQPPAIIAPGLQEIGAMLPYSPLHHLLLNAFDAPLVATSGNLSGEPVLTDNGEAERRLAPVADAFLHHNRPILRPADDPLYRCIHGSPRPLRLGRGTAPLELALPFELKTPLLALGGQMKNSVALAWEGRGVLSPHIGDLDAPRALQVLEQTQAELQRLYGIAAEQLVVDAHPGYASHRRARESSLPVTVVQHHHAHASALYGEYWQRGEKPIPWLVLTWDGVGYGSDGSLWGGEALFGRPGDWQRFATLRPFRLPGGEKAARQPWRSALAVCWETAQEWQQAPADTELLRQAWQQGVNSPVTSAAGRLFDAAAALIGLCDRASFEGQGPMWLEAACKGEGRATPLALTRQSDGLWLADWQPLIPPLCDTRQDTAQRAADFHASLAGLVLQLAERAREQHGIHDIGLCGGVFQNRRLCEQSIALLRHNGFVPRLPQRVPGNDGGLAWGQIIEAGAQSSIL
jgi:hydrogenase maturation protein HypF